MNVGKLALSALQRLLSHGMEHAQTNLEHQAAVGKGMDSAEMCTVSRQVTEDNSTSRISAEPSVQHATPEREAENKRSGVTSDSGEAVQEGPVQSLHRADSSPAVQLLSHNVEETLRSFLYSWGRKLVELQPKVHMSEHLVESGLFLWKCLRQLQLNACCEGSVTLADLSNEVLLIHDLIACFWVAMKHCSIRTQVPNRTLVSKATGAQPELLGQRELAALLLLDWDVNALLRAGGFIV